MPGLIAFEQWRPVRRAGNAARLPIYRAIKTALPGWQDGRATYLPTSSIARQVQRHGRATALAKEPVALSPKKLRPARRHVARRERSLTPTQVMAANGGAPITICIVSGKLHGSLLPYHARKGQIFGCFRQVTKIGRARRKIAQRHARPGRAKGGTNSRPSIGHRNVDGRQFKFA